MCSYRVQRKLRQFLTRMTCAERKKRISCIRQMRCPEEKTVIVFLKYYYIGPAELGQGRRRWSACWKPYNFWMRVFCSGFRRRSGRGGSALWWNVIRPWATETALDYFIAGTALLETHPESGDCFPAGPAAGLFMYKCGHKAMIHRPRPYTVVEGLIPLLTSGDPNSFPSGHTCAAFAAGLSWAGKLPAKWARGVSVVLAVCMGCPGCTWGSTTPATCWRGR